MTSFNIGATGSQLHERNQEATLYVAGIDPQCSDTLLWELFIQAGPVVNIYVPKDRVTSMHQGYGFVEYMTEDDAEYAAKVLNMVKLFGRPLRVNKSSSSRKGEEITPYSANLFVGNLDGSVDEKMLYDTFSAFGVIVQTPKIQRETDSGASKGFGFVVFDTFEAADKAIEAMNGQFLANRAISVAFAFKKDSKGERHGSAKERMLAAQFRKEKGGSTPAVNIPPLIAGSGAYNTPAPTAPVVPQQALLPPVHQYIPAPPPMQLPVMPGMPGMPLLNMPPPPPMMPFNPAAMGGYPPAQWYPQQQ